MRSALSERMLAKLRAAGVDQPVPRAAFEEALEDVPGAAGAASAKCARLGIDATCSTRSKLPPPSLGAPRLPMCTVGLLHTGLWERFRTKCGTPLPAEAPPIACELRTSRGGGNVVVPLAPVAA